MMRTIPAVLVATRMVGLPTATFGQQVREAPPGSPRMLVATAFSSAMEDGSERALEALVTDAFAPDMRDAFPMAEHLGQLSELAHAAAEITFAPRSETAVEIHLVTSEGARTIIVITFETTAPHLITGVAFEEG